jgi:hypothetical protein
MSPKKQNAADQAFTTERICEDYTTALKCKNQAY